MSHLHDVDGWFRVVIEEAPASVESNPASKEGFCRFFSHVREFSTSAHEALDGIATMLNHAEQLGRQSRDLRRPLRRLRVGLRAMVEGQGITDEWISLMDASVLVCDEPVATS